MSTVNSLVTDISNLINVSKDNQQKKYTVVMKQIVQALNGVDPSFIRNAEFYSDLKETLVKIHRQLLQSSKRKLISRIVMSKRDNHTINEIQEHVDSLCGRIFFSYAQQRKMHIKFTR